MYPEQWILIGAAIGLALATIATWVMQSEWWHHLTVVWQWRRVTRRSELRRIRRTTRAALAHSGRARRRVSLPVALIPEQRGRHRAGAGRVECDARPQPKGVAA